MKEIEVQDNYERHFEKSQSSKCVLAFNASGILVAMFSSVNIAGEMTGVSAQIISACCTGRNVSSRGLYFRHFDREKYTLTAEELGVFTVFKFDEIVGEERKYKSFKLMNNEKKRFLNKQ